MNIKILFMISAVILLHNGLASSSKLTKQKYSPLILVPGDGGSRLYVRSDADSHWICLIGHSWTIYWLNTLLWLPLMEHCLGTYFRLYFNRTTRRTYEYPGIESRVSDWGTTTGIDYLGYLHTDYEEIYAPTSGYLQEAGFVNNVTLRGAPFDFRVAPNENIGYFRRLKGLVEETYYKNNNARVMLLCHSMGNLYMNYFLNHMSRAWKKKFVRGYIAVSAPIGGAVKSLLAETAGIRFSNKISNMEVVRTVLRSMPSTGFNFPSPSIWGANEVLARRPGRNYTVSNYKQLFEDVKNLDGWEMYQETKHLIDPHWQPDVDEIYCAYGVNVETPEMLEWTTNEAFPATQPKILHGNGDGTVNLRSLQLCHNWKGVKVMNYPGAGHKRILGDKRLLADLLHILRIP